MKDKADIGMIGLAVMGENLALNMESKGFTVAVYNRTVPGVEEGVVDRFIRGRGQGKELHRIGEDRGFRAIAGKAAQDHDDGESRQAGGRIDRSTPPSAGQRRHPDRRRQFPFPGHDPADKIPGIQRDPVHRHGRFRRRRRRAARTVHHARRFARQRGRT